MLQREHRKKRKEGKRRRKARGECLHFRNRP